MTQWSLADVIGYVAASLVLSTFCVGSMGALRGMAIASNLSFIAYGYLSDIKPVLLLHAALLPVSIFRFVQFLFTRQSIICDSLADIRHIIQAMRSLPTSSGSRVQT